MMIDEAFLNAPYAAYRRMRAAGPLHWDPQFCGGAWLLLEHADVTMAIRDERFCAQRAAGWINSSGPDAARILRPFKQIFVRSLLFTSGRQHARLRLAMQACLRPASLQALLPDIETVAEQLIERMLASGAGAHSDFIAGFASPLPALVIARLLAIPNDDLGDFIDWSEHISAFIGSPTPNMALALDAQAGAVAMHDYFEALLPQRRRHPGTDLVSRLIVVQQAGEIVNSKQLLAQCCTLLFAGYETMRAFLGNSMLALLQHPQQWEQLRQSPQLMPSAIRELLRYDSPVQYTGRRLKADLTLHGRTLKKGELVIALIGAANHDPARYSAPEQLILTRDEGANLAFGAGPHACIGAALTHLEAQVALRCLLRRLPDVALAASPPVYKRSAGYRSLASLPLQLAPERAYV